MAHELRSLMRLLLTRAPDDPSGVPKSG